MYSTYTVVMKPYHKGEDMVLESFEQECDAHDTARIHARPNRQCSPNQRPQPSTFFPLSSKFLHLRSWYFDSSVMTLGIQPVQPFAKPRFPVPAGSST